MYHPRGDVENEEQGLVIDVHHVSHHATGQAEDAI
jgi:hypothetical protein